MTLLTVYIELAHCIIAKVIIEILIGHKYDNFPHRCTRINFSSSNHAHPSTYLPNSTHPRHVKCRYLNHIVI